MLSKKELPLPLICRNVEPASWLKHFKIAQDAVDFNSVWLTFSLLPIRTWGLFQKSCLSGCTAAVALSVPYLSILVEFPPVYPDSSN